MKQDFIQALSAQIRDIRLKKNISLNQLAKNIGKKHQTLIRMEQGKVNPSLFYLSEVAEGLGITIEELVRGLP